MAGERARLPRWNVARQRSLPPADDVVPGAELEADVAVAPDRRGADRLAERDAGRARQGDSGERLVGAEVGEHVEQSSVQTLADAAVTRRGGRGR